MSAENLFRLPPTQSFSTALGFFQPVKFEYLTWNAEEIQMLFSESHMVVVSHQKSTGFMGTI